MKISREYLGIIEKPGNTGWDNQAFHKLMVRAGWYKGAPWCMFFAKAMYMLAYANDAKRLKVVKNCFTGGAIDTLKRVHKDNTFKTGTEPMVGAIAIYRHGNSDRGHVAIVESFEADTQTNIEGNTNASGSREGDRVARKLRTVKRDFKANGLNLVGYIYPLD